MYSRPRPPITVKFYGPVPTKDASDCDSYIGSENNPRGLSNQPRSHRNFKLISLPDKGAVAPARGRRARTGAIATYKAFAHGICRARTHALRFLPAISHPCLTSRPTSTIMPAYRSKTSRYPESAPHALQPLAIGLTPYAHPHADACASLAYSVSHFSLQEASTVLEPGAVSHGHLRDLMSPRTLVMQPQPSPPLPTLSPRLNRPYPARGHQNSYRTARKYAATEHRSTSPTTHVLRGPGQGINPYAALHDYIGREYAALEHRPTSSNTQDSVHSLLRGHGIDPYAAFRDYVAATEPHPQPHPTLSNSPPGLHSMPDSQSQLNATIKQLGHRLAFTTLEDANRRSHKTHATNGSVDMGSEDEEVHGMWVQSWASSSEDTGSDYSISEAEL